MSSRRPEDEALPRAWVDAWRGDAAEPAQLRRAYHRFLRERRPARGRATVLEVARWVLVGVVIGVGSVYAATGSLRLLGKETSSAEPSATRVPAPAGSVRHGSSNGSRPPATAALAQPEPQIAPVPALPGLPAPVTSTGEQWQRAARGLREKDFATAQAALDELAQRGSSSERESARLVQAQLLISRGRNEDAAVTLRELQRSAQSSAVRAKATELLSRNNESPPSQRSFAPAEGTNEP
jgi:hypothetical protein